MNQVMVQYRVRADRAAENEAFIARVFEQLANERPEGLRYASFKLDDGVSFIHIASYEAADGANPLGGLSTFKAFTAGIANRCVEAPMVVELNEVRSYRFFDD